MAINYTQLTQALQDYLTTDEPTFVTNIPIIVKQAEDRILKNVQLPDFRKSVVLGNYITADSEYADIPSDFLAPYSFALVNGPVYDYLIFKDVSFIRAAYPDREATAQSKYYGIFDSTSFIFGPTPSFKKTVEIHYFYRPTSIVDGATSWLGDNAESCLLYGCLVEAYTFQKGDPDMLKLYTERYKEALSELKVLGDGRNRTDSYRNG